MRGRFGKLFLRSAAHLLLHDEKKNQYDIEGKRKHSLLYRQRNYEERN